MKDEILDSKTQQGLKQRILTDPCGGGIERWARENPEVSGGTQGEEQITFQELK